jgi:outer membrane protein OmpA-like peptidoglycan-associated protein
MQKFLFVFVLFNLKVISQSDSLSSKKETVAPAFNLFMKENAIKKMAFPYMKRIVLLHFWSGNVKASRANHQEIKSIKDRYKNAYYKTAEGFEVITISLKTEKSAWLESVKNDSLTTLINGMALGDFEDDACKKYNVSSLPHDILIDEKGNIIANNPSMHEVEALLSERKIFQPVKRDLSGILAQSLNKNEVLKSSNVYLFSVYGDSLSKGVTYSNGKFVFNNIKLNQDLILKIPNQKDMDPADPIALFSTTDEFLIPGKRIENSCEFFIPYKMVYSLLDATAANAPKEQMNKVNNMEFTTSGGFQLSPKDEQELDALYLILQKIKTLTIEFKTFTDSKLTEAAAMDITGRQVQLIKNYLLKKGIPASRIKGIPKGKSILLKPCGGNTPCTEEDHRQNRRVEFLIS